MTPLRSWDGGVVLPPAPLPILPIEPSVAPLPDEWAGHGPLFGSVGEVLEQVQPEDPLQVWRPAVLAATAERFVRGFSGTPFFAVKCNPAPMILRALFAAGVQQFDVASVEEVRTVAAACPGAAMIFMHPVKSIEAIRVSSHDFGVRVFSLDDPRELKKILAHVPSGANLTLVVRLAVPNDSAKLKLDKKFGASPAMAVRLLRMIAAAGQRAGLSFHVGSQCGSPDAYGTALRLCAKVVAKAGVALDVLNVGGGFPAAYDPTVPVLEEYFAAIDSLRRGLPELRHAKLWAEPGRALVAAAGSVLARVELRKGHSLYLNDGVYGGLNEAGPQIGVVHPVTIWRNGKVVQAATVNFKCYGPTCDSLDVLPGPYALPASVRAGDWLEFGMAG
ncbi:MAG: type III PLP-dependent enzyme, partial [Proteobacteria bacterium]|nr:type III PLP-dependent enzyme [Pseudomonadota bacterium]